MVSLRTWLWWINWVVLGTVGYAAGMATDQGLMFALEARTPHPAPSLGHREQAAPRKMLALSAFQPILETNVFKAQRSKVASAPVAEGANGAAPQTTGPAALNLTLTGTLITDRRAFALVIGPDGRTEEVYRKGDCIPANEEHPTPQCQPNQGRLVRIRKNNIGVLFQGHTLSFDLTTESRPAHPAARVAARRPVQPRPAVAGNTFPSVRNGNTIEMRVPNTEVEKSFENFASILKQARVVPFSGQGIQGFQIRNIQPGSVFQRIGLQNFDIIKSVNGEAIATADQAMRLLTAFRNERQVVLDIRRRNQNLKLSYLIE